MPVIEYIKDSKHQGTGRKIPKGSQHIVTKEFAKLKCEENVAIIVGTQTGKAEQVRTSAINDLSKGEKSKRLKQDDPPEKEKKKSKKSKTKSDKGGS